MFLGTSRKLRPVAYICPENRWLVMNRSQFATLKRAFTCGSCTPRMEEILKQTYSGVINLREYAGCAGSRACKKTGGQNDLALHSSGPRFVLRKARNANCVM
jgi:hypothetical protein